MTNAKATLICHRDDAFSIDTKDGKARRKGATRGILFRLFTSFFGIFTFSCLFVGRRVLNVESATCHLNNSKMEK
jgi:hypothetical protein